MSSTEFIGFQCDYSDGGTLTLQLQDSRKRKPGHDQRPPTILVPLWFPLRLDSNGAEEVVEGEHYVSCSNSGSEFFISQDEFEKRVPSPNRNLLDVYREDWAASDDKPDSLSCVAYDDDGTRIGGQGARAWPRRGLIAAKPRSKSPDEAEKARLAAQAAIWCGIATRSTSAGASRLWKSNSRIDPPLKVYFLPGKTIASWPLPTELKRITDEIRDEEETKKKGTVRRLALTDWVEWEVPGSDFNSDDHVLLSTNLLRLYDTYISREDFARLVNAQTEDSGESRRPWPTQAVAKTVQDQMLNTLEKNKSYYDLVKNGLKDTTTTRLSSSKTFDKRIDANKIMGSTSANQLGKQWWGVGDTPKVVAEWLHRSAYSLGPLDSANFQSPDNIIFGTFEANSDMTRAETAIRTLRDVTRAEGSLTTTVITANSTQPGLDRLTYMDPATGTERTWNIDEWIANDKYTWIAPVLVYNGHMTFSADSMSVAWKTRFHPFSRYSPLVLEGKLDSRLLTEYLKVCSPDPGRTPQPGKKHKPGPSSSNVASTASARQLLVAAPKLSAAPAPPPSSRLVRSNALTRQKRDLDAALIQAVGVKKSGVLVTHPRTYAAWQSIVKKTPHITVGDVRLSDPHLADDGNDIGVPTDGAPPATGFMLEGTIKLFGLDHYEVSLQSWHGPPPPGVDVGSDVPIYQRVLLPSVRPSDLIPLLEETPFANFEFKNVTITYQNYQFVQGTLPGWTITADIDIDEKAGTLHGILHDVLGLSGSGLQVQASVYLGLGHSWSSRPRVPSFVVTGVLEVASKSNEIEHDPSGPNGVQLCKGVVLSRVGVSIYGVSVPTFGIKSTEHTQYGFRVFGDMHVSVPGSVTPLDLDLELGEFGGVVNLDATVKGGSWKNAFGVGIDLDMVQLSASFPLSSVESLTCSVCAHLQAESASALITGSFTVNSSYSLSAYVEDLGCEGIVDLFRHYTGDELSLPEHVEVTIGSATIKIENNSGLYIEVDKLAFDSYEASRAIVQLSSKGVRVRADMKKIELPENIGLSLVSGFMEVSFEKQGSSKSTDVALGGKVQLDGFSSSPSIDASVHLYKSSTSKGLEWTVYGSFTLLGNTTTLGELFPGLKGSFLQDFALQDMLFIAASRDDPLLSQMNPLKYPIKKGVQFSALLGEVDPFNKLLRRDSFPGLILSASWRSGSSFVLDVVLPTDTLIHLGHGITTDPITLSINTEQLLLQIATGVQVSVPESDTPLDFEAALTIKGEDVKLEGQMNGLWKDPLGVSRSVAIGPFLELGLNLDLLVFTETGIPTSFSFAGGLVIGETKGQVAVQISEIPSHELVYGEIQNFGIQDVVAFARDVTQLHIPMPPNFIYLEDVKLYISTGVTLGTTIYPAGFSFDASVTVFGAHFHASAEISGGALRLSGSVDSFTVGPLHITGQRGVNPTVDLLVGATVQQLKADGAIEFLGAHVSVALDLELLPNPTFSFGFHLNFTDLLVFTVEAQMLGHIADLHDLSGLDFSLHAVFEQHVVEYVRDHVVAALEALKNKTDDAVHAAEAKVQEEEKKLQAGIDAAQGKLTKAYESWTRKADQVHKDSQAFIDNYMAKLKTLQDNVEDKRKAYNADIKAAEGSLQHANADRAAKMKVAEADVTKAKNKWDADVAAAEKKLDDANRYMQEKFGSAERDIDDAKRKVDSIQGEVDSTNSRIRYCENSPWYRFDLKAELIWLGPKLLVLEGSKATADGILWLAKKVVEGTAYLEANAAIPAAKKLVEDVGGAGDLAFKGAQATLREVDNLSAAAIKAAESVLETVRKDGDALIQGAEYALQKFTDANLTLLTAAQHAVDDLIHSTEWLAYQAASGALDLAKQMTHGLDVAKAALEVAKKVVDGTIEVTEEVVEAALSALDIRKIELATTLNVFLHGKGGFHFEADIEGVIIGKPFKLQLKLDMANTAQLIIDIFHELLKEL